jgi:protein-glucosylgalactosylhydroxylysine glucosidase
MKKIICLFGLILYAAALPAQNNQSAWQVQATTIDPANYHGVTLANGMIGMVSSAEPLQVKDIVLNGAFDTYGRGRVANILKVFDFTNIELAIDGNRLGRTNIADYVQSLDMQKASLISAFSHASKVSVTYTLRALRHLPHTAMMDVEITARKDIEFTAASVLSSPEMLREVKNFYHLIDRPHALIPLQTSVAQSPTGKLTVAASNSFLFEEERGKEPALIHEEWDYGYHRMKFTKKLKSGSVYRFTLVGSVTSSGHVADPHNEAERLTIFAALEKRSRLLKRHEEAWNKLWESDILIEGDLDAQKAAHFALYNLYSFAREGTAYSLSPMGLSGLGYNGHIFWDTELWMYPPLLLLQPEIARSLLEYRYQRLEAAKANARSHGFKGAMYPWESADDGQEATPVWALTGPFQHHITGCVGYAFWKYYQVTRDKAWLTERGYPVLKEVADFWASRVEKGSDGKYHIINVVAADEYAENVDDNSFTNGIAKEVLGYAFQAARELGLPENKQWKEIADGLVILKMQDGTTREHATYNGEVIKQADANLLAYPLKAVTDEATIRKDLMYYEAKVDPLGPAMSHAVFAVLYARLGNPDEAYQLFTKSYKPNEVPPFGVIAETAGGTNPYFATGAGGMLQALINGLGGLDITEDGIVALKTSLPKKWKSLTIKGVGIENKSYTIR